MSRFEETIIDHLNIGVSDVERSREFYARALAPLGLRLMYSIPPEAAEPGGVQASAGATIHGFGREHKPLFWIVGNVTVGQGLHFAFIARTRAEVDAFHGAALAAGGTDHGAPGIRRYHEHYYAAFVRDPDGINIEAVCHAAQ